MGMGILKAIMAKFTKKRQPEPSDSTQHSQYLESLLKGIAREERLRKKGLSCEKKTD
jgi:hypothetical protein